MGVFKFSTLSFDDGVTQDIRLIELLKKYGLTATFNLNSALCGARNRLVWRDTEIEHVRVRGEDVARVYKGFEVAAHTLHHPQLPDCSEETIVEEAESDRRALSELVGYEVIGMAYPCGPPNSDRRVRDTVERFTGIRYARTIRATHDLSFYDDPLLWNPSAHIFDEDVFDLIEAFDRSQSGLLYLWGHAYEFDTRGGWAHAERVLERLSRVRDAQNLTNGQVYERLRLEP